MPTNVADFSALSEIIHDEPCQLYVWELTPAEYVEQMKNPRKFEKMGVELPENCPIMTEMLNHDFFAADIADVRAADTPPIKVCNMGGGNTGIAAYRITSYAHLESDVGPEREEGARHLIFA
jgi:hypothetical protein